ncbi:MAG: DNA cytosine methyltransferase [Phycisphaerales bacterium]|nr:DNA cytosine methyltransferase [Phycisphaerales bacterium]
MCEQDLREFTQVHLFAGIGGWSHALRLAGWPDDRPVWTGSCPCQPFSQAGKKLAQKDDRDLWPEFFRLIRECRPPTIFGEQVTSELGRQWLAGVRTDLEAPGYAVGAADLCAASVGSPHIRQRLFWVAHADRPKRRRRNKQTDRHAELLHASSGRSLCRLANTRSLLPKLVTNNGAAQIAEQRVGEASVEFTGCRGDGGLDHALNALAESLRPFQKREFRPSPAPASPPPPAPPPHKEYLTTEELAAKFGVTKETVLSWDIPRFKPNKRTVLFRVQDVLDFESSHTVGRF